jgi:hypothetical protein
MYPRDPAVSVFEEAIEFTCSKRRVRCGMSALLLKG